MAKTTRRRRYAVPISALFVILAAIGLVTVVVGAIRLTFWAVDNTPELNKIREIVRPVVMWDPVPFEDPDDIDPTQMLYYSMWAAIMQNSGGFDLDEQSQGTIVPAIDLEVAAANLFGREIQLEHRSLGELTDINVYYYDADRHVYIVPTVSLPVYSPMVDSLEKRGDLYYARIGYLPPSGNYTVDYQGDVIDPEPEKYMIYVLRRDSGTYYLTAVHFDDQYYEMYGDTVEQD